MVGDHPGRGPRRGGRLAVGAAVVVALAACTPGPGPAPSPTATADTTPTPDVLREDEEALAAQVESLRASVDAVRASLADAVEGDDEALLRAGRLLAADLDAATDPDVARAAADAATDPEVDGDETTVAPVTVDGLAPLLPGPAVSRSTTVSYGDLLTSTLAAARGAGSAGEPVARFLATPLAGDLGVWQRSPADLLALVAEAGTTPDVDEATAAVLELEGEAPRALAWVVHGLTTPTPADVAAGRAGAHLAVIETALEDL